MADKRKDDIFPKEDESMKKRRMNILLAGMLSVSILMGGCGSTSEVKKEADKQEERSESTETETASTEKKDEAGKTTENTADGNNSSESKDETGKTTENTADGNNTSESKGSEPVTVKVADGYENAGFTMYVCEETGTYEFFTEDPKETGVEWEVYLLDEEFDDAVRYIPQAYEKVSLKDDRYLDIKEGQYVYVYCSENAFTGGDADNEATYTFSIVKEN